MSDIEREAFEQRFPVPYGVKWSERRNDYTYEFIQALQEACNYSGKWHAWQAARQAPASCNNGQDCEHCEPEHGCKAPASGEVEPVARIDRTRRNTHFTPMVENAHQLPEGVITVTPIHPRRCRRAKTISAWMLDTFTKSCG